MILEIYLKQWPWFVDRIQRGVPFGLEAPTDPTTPDALIEQNIMVSFGYALAGANKPQIPMLDWGGGVGHYYLAARSLLPGVAIDYHCKDVPLLVQQGHKLFPEAHF